MWIGVTLAGAGFAVTTAGRATTTGRAMTTAAWAVIATKARKMAKIVFILSLR